MKTIKFLEAFIRQWEAIDGSPELTAMYEVFCSLSGLDSSLSADDQLYAILEARRGNEEIKFQFKDKTGRGIVNTFNLNEIYDMEDEQDYGGEWLHGWAESAEEGDEWDSSTSRYTRIIVNIKYKTNEFARD